MVFHGCVLRVSSNKVRKETVRRANPQHVYPEEYDYELLLGF